MFGERIFIGTGSNVGDRRAMLEFAQHRVNAWIGKVIQTSPVYVNPAWGFEGPDFFNQVLEVQSTLHPLELLGRLKELEDFTGRMRAYQGYSNRTLDLDILFHGNRRMDHHELTLPHSFVESRRFVLAPLAEIAPEFIDPRSGKTVLELLKRCPDISEGRWL